MSRPTPRRDAARAIRRSRGSRRKRSVERGRGLGGRCRRGWRWSPWPLEYTLPGSIVIRRTLFLLSLAAVLTVVPTFVSGQRASRDSRPDFEGIWNSATATPLERPSELK